MLHTFVIPVYKESPFLEECFNSLQNQTVPSKIVLTTSTPSIVTETFAKKHNLDYHIRKNDKKGIGYDWNYAMNIAQTPYITIAHQDDVYHPEFVATVLKSMLKENKSLISFTDYLDIVDGKIRKTSLNSLVKKLLLLPFLMKPVNSSILIKKSILIFGNSICCPSVTYCMKNIGDFRFSTSHKFVLDWLAWITLSEMNGDFIYLNKKLVHHRIHKESETSMQSESGLRKKEELKVFSMFWGRRLAALIFQFYKIGHKGNKI